MTNDEKAELLVEGIDALSKLEESLTHDLEEIYRCMNSKICPRTEVMYVIEKQLRRKGLWIEEVKK